MEIATKSMEASYSIFTKLGGVIHSVNDHRRVYIDLSPIQNTRIWDAYGMQSVRNAFDVMIHVPGAREIITRLAIGNLPPVEEKWPLSDRNVSRNFDQFLCRLDPATWGSLQTMIEGVTTNAVLSPAIPSSVQRAPTTVHVQISSRNEAGALLSRHSYSRVWNLSTIEDLLLTFGSELQMAWSVKVYVQFYPPLNSRREIDVMVSKSRPSTLGALVRAIAEIDPDLWRERQLVSELPVCNTSAPSEKP